MPAWVVILLFLAALVCGYMGMDGLDRFLEHREESLPPVPKAQTLVFGQNGNVIPVREWFQKAKICYDEIDAPSLPREGSYDLVLALSTSDVDNLLLLTQAKKRFAGVSTCALLSDTMYLPVFEQAGIDYILTGHGDNEITELLNHVHPHA